MTDVSTFGVPTQQQEVVPVEEKAPTAIQVLLGNDSPVGGGGPEVAVVTIPQGDDPYGHLLYSFPDEHDDAIFAAHDATAHIAVALAGVNDPEAKKAVRRAMINGQFAHPSGVKGLPDHAAASVVIHPAGVWATIAKAGSVPSFVSSNHAGYEEFLADYFDCPRGLPANVEDTHTTYHGSGVYPPGAAPDPVASVEMMHTTWGCLNQSFVMGGYTPYTGTSGSVGTASASSATTLTGSSESGPTHATNDAAGYTLQVGPNASGTGSKVYGLVISNTSGTTPVYTVDRWYNPATPGGAAGTTPNATSFYQILNGPSAMFVALTTDSTVPSFGGTAATADAPLITTLLTGEIAAQPTGLLRKVGVITIGAHTWINTVSFTIQSGDTSLPTTIAKAALSPSVVPALAGGGALTYMSTMTAATLALSGDSLTLTWTFTETNT